MTRDRTDRPPTAAEARAQVEARREQDRAERAERFRAAYGDTVPGRWVGVVSWCSTLVLAVVTVAAVVDPDDLIAAFFGVAVVWFFAGAALFALVLVLAAARSRDDVMGIGGLFFLAGCAPSAVQWSLLGSLVAQVVISVAGAAVRPFTPLAFGVLAPTLPLALCGLWAVRYGVFPAAEPDGRRGGGRG